MQKIYNYFLKLGPQEYKVAKYHSSSTQPQPKNGVFKIRDKLAYMSLTRACVRRLRLLDYCEITVQDKNKLKTLQEAQCWRARKGPLNHVPKT